MLGDETLGVGHLLEMSYPVANGVIQNMDEMCLLWDYAFYSKLNQTSDSIKSRRLMMSEPPSFSTRARAKIYETMFEKYQLDSVQSGVQGVLSLFSNGLETGVAIECGEGVTHCTPIFEGYSIPKGNRRVDLGGRNITEFLIRLMQRRGYSFNKSSDFEVVRVIKERFCYAAVDIDLEKRLSLETTTLEKAMTLPDGSTIKIGQERFEATEALFSPHLIDVESEGLSGQLWSCIQGCDIDLRSKLYEHVVLSGGSTMFPGLPSRIEKDMRGFFLKHSAKGDVSRMSRFKLSIEDPPRRKYMVFLGAAVTAKMTESTPENWMTKAEWEEVGESALRSRFGSL
eukprot:GILI01021223.1.p1 GENE.GILI01021223.1~~GILI01021223.1.p1  ORF type:complete len:354 (-),score=30.81 GILI01021223.1:68-1090(-)